VVYINPIDMGRVSWEIYFSETKQMLMRGERVTNLVLILYTGSLMVESDDIL